MRGKEKKNWNTAAVVKQLLFTVVIMANGLAMLAQSNSSSVPGVYSLYGVSEVASQLWLKEDGSFEFFFSYGAVDRTGKGRWTVNATDSGRLVLNSETRPSRDFALTASSKTKDRLVTIKINDPNTAVLPFVLARLHTTTGVVEKRADSKGYITVPLQSINKIEIALELCADRFSVFVPQNSQDNFFEFGFEPWIAEVFFNNITLQKTAGGLKGYHPLLEGSEFIYEKAGK
ncbi:MAG: hypothetical protein KF746_09610 [Chitinophagaceae bacterium]|nr:hypothetical protein [Chitinophagaceae bacterium]